MLSFRQFRRDCGLSLTFRLVLANTHTGARFRVRLAFTRIVFFSGVLTRAIVL